MSASAPSNDLAARAATGDRTAFAQLLQLYRRPLLAYITRTLPVRLATLVDPNDVLQDTYFEAFRRIGSFRPDDEDAALRWMYTIARCRINELYRRQTTAKRVGGLDVADLTDDSVVVLLETLAAHSRTPSRSAAAHELERVLGRAVDELPSHYRDAVRLRFGEGLAFAEVADRLQRTEEGVRKLINRAVALLRLKLGSAA